MGRRYLTPEQAASVYDRIGQWQDTQAFYERPAVDAMVQAGRFGRATDVVEVGCGTGALADRLLTMQLPDDARYTALDVSATMLGLARDRLRGWGERVLVDGINGHDPWPVPDSSADRVVATYVLDLLSPAATTAFFAEAARVLRQDGVVTTVSLTGGTGGLARVVSAGWSALWRIHPRLTGGCRPVDTGALLPPGWQVHTHLVVTSWAITSSVLVAGPVD
jgi:ubiquinone/menaquinone biosynthesis C-methylase UbiE